MKNLEHKSLQLASVVAEEDMVFSGYASVFGVLDAYDEIVDKGAFLDTINEIDTKGKWPLMLSQHGGWGLGSQDMTPVGVWTEMREDDHGLYVKGKLCSEGRGKELYALMKMSPRPAINGMSIGFFVKGYEIKEDQGKEVRHLTKIDLKEISIVSFPANDEALITDVKATLPTIRDAERALRDAGFSRTESKQILSNGYKSLSLRDAEDSADDEIAALLRRNIAMLSRYGGGCDNGRGKTVN